MKKQKQYTNRRAELKFLLYNAARRLISPAWRSNTEAIKQLRDDKAFEYFKATPDELTLSQLCDLINYIDVESGHTPPDAVRPRYASRSQLKKLRYLAICHALNYADFSEFEYTSEETGAIRSGEGLRTWIKNRFEDHAASQYIPKPVFRQLFEACINPKINKIAEEKGWKKFTKNRAYYDWNSITREQAQHLIVVFNQIDLNYSQPVRPAEIEKHLTN